MKKKTEGYDSPEIETVIVDLSQPLAASQLENPVEGEGWSWDQPTI